MVRNIVVLGGSSHKALVAAMCEQLGIPPGNVFLGAFQNGETRVEIQDSVRGKDVFVVQTGSGHVNDMLMELLITISACKTASARRITAVLPLFPYSRQPDIPYNKIGAPLAKPPSGFRPDPYTFESRPGTPKVEPLSAGAHASGSLEKDMSRLNLDKTNSEADLANPITNGVHTRDANQTTSPNGTSNRNSRDISMLRRQNTSDSLSSLRAERAGGSLGGSTGRPGGIASEWVPQESSFRQTNSGYKQWVAQAGTLVADLLTCAGADHIITMDLHDPQYQGFFDIPVDNLYARPVLQRYIKSRIPDFQNAVVVSPDAGGAKRATAVADTLGLPFALIHKERRPTKVSERQNATMMLVGDISGRVAILVDDLADTSNTITRAAKLLKGRGGATKVYALLTHGVFSGDAIDRINASALDHVIVTNTLPQDEHRKRCPKLEVLDISGIFAEAVRRVHHGESISVLFRLND